MKRSVLLYAFLVWGCAKNVTAPLPETFEEMLLRTKGVTCIDITQSADGTDEPSCEAIYKYHMMAVNRLEPIFGPNVRGVKMHNVKYFRPTRIEMPPNVPSPVISREPYFYGILRVIMLPVYATVKNLAMVKQFGTEYKMTYLIEYGAEENIFCEELHRIFQEMDPARPAWNEVGHGTVNDPLQFDCTEWEFAEYALNHREIVQ